MMASLSKSTLLGFALLCLIWGSTWIAIKAGINAVPPMLFAGSRFTAAGIILLIIACFRPEPLRFPARQLPRLVLVSVLMISLCYGALFWGMQYVNSGTAAVLELSLTPIALMGFALILGEERWRPAMALAIVLGSLGLALLYGPDALSNASKHAFVIDRAWGMLAIALAAITYGLGSVLAKPLLRDHPPYVIAGATTTIGGVVLLCHSLIWENGAIAALDGRWGAEAWLGWLFLVLFGSLLGYTMFMRLLKDIGPSKAGSYAFVSPIVAVALGAFWFGERTSLSDIAGMVMMLAGAYLALTREGPVSRPPAQPRR